MEDDEVLTAVKQTLADVQMDRPLEAIEQRGRARRRNRGLIGAVAGGGLAAALALALPIASHHNGTAPAPSGPVAAGTTAGTTAPVQQVAFTVAKQVDGSVELTLDPKKILNPDALQKALADAGIPAVVKAGVLCTPKGKELPESKEVFRVKRVTAPDGSTFYDLVITPTKMPADPRRTSRARAPETRFGPFGLCL